MASHHNEVYSMPFFGDVEDYEEAQTSEYQMKLDNDCFIKKCSASPVNMGYSNKIDQNNNMCNENKIMTSDKNNNVTGGDVFYSSNDENKNTSESESSIKELDFKDKLKSRKKRLRSSHERNVRSTIINGKYRKTLEKRVSKTNVSDYLSSESNSIVKEDCQSNVLSSISDGSSSESNFNIKRKSYNSHMQTLYYLSSSDDSNVKDQLTKSRILLRKDAKNDCEDIYNNKNIPIHCLEKSIPYLSSTKNSNIQNKFSKLKSFLDESDENDCEETPNTTCISLGNLTSTDISFDHIKTNDTPFDHFKNTLLFSSSSDGIDEKQDVLVESEENSYSSSVKIIEEKEGNALKRTIKGKYNNSSVFKIQDSSDDVSVSDSLDSEEDLDDISDDENKLNYEIKLKNKGLDSLDYYMQFSESNFEMCAVNSNGVSLLKLPPKLIKVS